MPHCLQPVFDRIESLRDDMAESLSRLIQAPSVREAEEGRGDADQPGIGQALGIVSDLCARFGFSFGAVGDWVGYADMGSGVEAVGALLHLDVVPPGDGWEREPFGGEIVDGVVWGRGAQDDKGPTISVLYAAHAVAESGIPLRRRLRMIFGTDEESGIWEDIDRYLEAEDPPLMSFVPDGAFPITSGEKGIVNVCLLVETPVSVPGEGLRLESLTAGERANVVPDSGQAVLAVQSGLEEHLARLCLRAKAYNATHADAEVAVLERDAAMVVSAVGRGAHGSEPQDGHSAFLDLVDFLAAEDLAESAPAWMVAFVADRVGFDLCGEGLGIFEGEDFVGWTTVNIGRVDTLPDGCCRAVANVRIPITLSVEAILSRLASCADAYAERTGIPVKVRQIARAHEPLYVDPVSELIQALTRAYEAVTGQKAELRSTGGTTFAKSMPNCVAFGAAMDDDPATYHQANERTTIDVLVRNARIFAAAIVELCQG